MASDARARILEAACDLIASDGIDDVRIARVATRARASTALVHHYFSTREELLEQALIHSYETAGEERFADEAGAGPESDPRPRPRDRSVAPVPGRPGTRLDAVGRALAASGPRPGAAPRSPPTSTAATASGLRPSSPPGLSSGEFTSDRPAVELADLAVALVDGLGIRALVRDPAVDVERARELVASELGRALGVEPAALLATD